MPPDRMLPATICFIFEEGGRVPSVQIMAPDAVPSEGKLLPDTAQRLKELESLFPGNSSKNGTDGIKVRLEYPDRTVFRTIPAWLGTTFPIPGSDGRAWYRNIRGLLPTAGALLSALTPKTAASMLLAWFTEGMLTEDMLLGLVLDPELPGDRILASFSPRVRKDLSELAGHHGSGGGRWSRVAGAAFRINLLRDRKRLEKAFPAYSRLLTLATAAAGISIQGDSSFAERVMQLMAASGGERSAILSHALLVRACRGTDAEEVAALPGLFSRRGRERFLEDCRVPAASACPYERGAARFRVFHALARHQAKRRPYLERDILTFLKKGQTVADRRFLILHTGLLLLGNGLSVMGRRVLDALCRVGDADMMLLLEDLGKGSIVLEGGPDGRTAAWETAEEWQALAILGIWD